MKPACERCGHTRDDHCGCGQHCLHVEGEPVELAPPLAPGYPPLMGHKLCCECVGFQATAPS